MPCFVMLVTAVSVLFLLKLKWPKNMSFYLHFPSVKFFHTLPHHGNDVARHFELVKGQGRSDDFTHIL